MSKQPPVHQTQYFRYIDLAEIDDPEIREAFELWLIGRGAPIIEGRERVAYAQDWREFCVGGGM